MHLFPVYNNAATTAPTAAAIPTVDATCPAAAPLLTADVAAPAAALVADAAPDVAEDAPDDAAEAAPTVVPFALIVAELATFWTVTPVLFMQLELYMSVLRAAAVNVTSAHYSQISLSLTQPHSIPRNSRCKVHHWGHHSS